jgi:RimJ/RimL family protein N-acetyltransferase
MSNHFSLIIFNFNMKSIETKRLNLHHIEEKDWQILHSWRNSELFRHYCSTRRNVISFEQFGKEIQNDLGKDRHTQLIAYRKKNSIPVGTIWTYKMNPTDGHVFITTFVESAYEKSGYGVEMFAAIIYSLFTTLPALNKIYTEVYSYNKHSLSIMKKF